MTKCCTFLVIFLGKKNFSRLIYILSNMHNLYIIDISLDCFKNTSQQFKCVFHLLWLLFICIFCLKLSIFSMDTISSMEICQFLSAGKLWIKLGTGGVQGQVKGQRLMGIKAVNDSIGLALPWNLNRSHFHCQ